MVGCIVAFQYELIDIEISEIHLVSREQIRGDTNFELKINPKDDDLNKVFLEKIILSASSINRSLLITIISCSPKNCCALAFIGESAVVAYPIKLKTFKDNCFGSFYIFSQNSKVLLCSQEPQTL